MRIVEAKKRIEHVYKKPYPLRLTNFRYSNITSLGSNAISFSGGISAICGANGVGKSTLLKAIYCSLAKIENLDPRFGQPILNSTIISETGENTIEVDYSKKLKEIPENEFYIEFIDPSKSAISLISYFSEVENLEEWLETVTPVEFSEKELETISQLVGKKYDYLKVFELEEDDDEGALGNPLLYFEVSSNGRAYGTPTMGMGELVLLFTYWRLARIDTEAIILLEEPDTYVSYASQEELFNIIAKFSDEKNLWVILTTHSTAIASKIPLQHMTLLFTHNGETLPVQNPQLHQVLRMLGLPEKRDGLLLIEDDAAEHFLKALISIFDPSILKQFAIINLGGNGKIITSLKGIPKELGFQTIGVFDPDMKSSPDTRDLKWTHVYLPGDGTPEQIFMRIANTWHEAFSKMLSRNHQELRVILAEVEAQEHHNWLDRLCERLDLDKPFVIFTLIKVWSEIDEERDQLIAFIDLLKSYAKK